jgi:hypothetical protein
MVWPNLLLRMEQCHLLLGFWIGEGLPRRFMSIALGAGQAKICRSRLTISRSGSDMLDLEFCRDQCFGGFAVGAAVLKLTPNLPLQSHRNIKGSCHPIQVVQCILGAGFE